MTNAEKYKTAIERTEAFWRLYRGYIHDAVRSFAEWIDKEAEEEKPLPCPFCGHATTVGSCSIDPDGVYVTCMLCDYRSVMCKKDEEAIAAHNRVAKAVMDVKEKEAAK